MNRARSLRSLAAVILGLILAVYIGLPVAMAVAAAWPSRAEVGEPPAGFEEVALATADGVPLAAWYRPTQNGAAVIVAHGAGGSRESLRELSRVLGDAGYGVLALDLSGHGESGGTTNRLAWHGTADLTAAVDYLLAQDPELEIGAYGSSMGGEAVLGASGANPAIKAIVADGATRRSVDELLALPSERPLVRNFTARVWYRAAQVLTRQQPPAPLLAEMTRASDTRFLLIAAGKESLEVAFNELFADTLGERSTLWVVPDVDHTTAMTAVPEEYFGRLLTFFGEHLIETGS